MRCATVSKRGNTRIAVRPPGADTALPVAASTRPRIARDSAADLPSSPATVRAASTCFEDSSSVFQADSPPRRRALSDESAANGERPASISPSTRSSAALRCGQPVERGGIAARGGSGLCRHAAGEDGELGKVLAVAAIGALGAACEDDEHGGHERGDEAADEQRRHPLRDRKSFRRVDHAPEPSPLVPQFEPCRNAGLSTSVRKLSTGQASLPRRNDPAR